MNSPIPFCLAKCPICVVGSDPIDSKQTNGVLGSDSCHVASKSNICISLYSGPRDSENERTKEKCVYLIEKLIKFIGFVMDRLLLPSMYILACAMVRSGHQERMSNNLRKLSKL